MGLPGLAERALTGQSSAILAQRVFPLIVTISLGWLVLFSTVPANLWVVKGDPAELITLSYAALMAALAVFPQWERGHFIGATLSGLVFGGRAGGFYQRAIDVADWSTDWDSFVWWLGPDPNSFGMSWLLMANSLERVILAVGMVLWHAARVKELTPLHP